MSKRPRSRWPSLAIPQRNPDSVHSTLTDVVETLQLYQAERGSAESSEFVPRDEINALSVRLKNIEEALGIPSGTIATGPGDSTWQVDPAEGTLYVANVPDIANPPGIGLDAPHASPSYVAVGDAQGARGFIAGVNDAEGGGIQLVGFQGTTDPSGGGIDEPDAPAHVVGTTVALHGTFVIEAQTADSTERHLIVGPTESVGGRLYRPVELGPEVVWSFPPERQIDTSDKLFADLESWFVPGINFSPSRDYTNLATTVWEFGVQLGDESTRSCTFDLNFYVNGALVFSRTGIARNAVSDFYSEQRPIAQSLLTTDVVTMEVVAYKDHQGSQPWVRGSVRETYVGIKEG